LAQDADAAENAKADEETVYRR